MKNRTCKNDNCKDSNENCQVLGFDGFPVQCVGVWVKDKYYYLGRYLNASREVRKKFSNRNNAVFIDLFTGPGKCVIKDEDREINGGALRVLNREEAQFNESFLFDINADNVKALDKRIDKKFNYHAKCGDSNILIKYKDELSKIGCKFVFDLRPVVIKNTKNAPLYNLILASKEPLAQKIWNTVINRSPNGQKSFNF